MYGIGILSQRLKLVVRKFGKSFAEFQPDNLNFRSGWTELFLMPRIAPEPVIHGPMRAASL